MPRIEIEGGEGQKGLFAAVASLTQTYASQSFRRLVDSGHGFEAWWKFQLLLDISDPKIFGRKVRYRAGPEAVGVSIEQPFEIPSRHRVAKELRATSRKPATQVDLVIARCASPKDTAHHALELKLIPLSKVGAQSRKFTEDGRRLGAACAPVSWIDSAWCVALVYDPDYTAMSTIQSRFRGTQDGTDGASRNRWHEIDLGKSATGVLVARRVK